MIENPYEQYKICQVRGHTPSGFLRGDGFTACLYCGTYFRYMSTLVEDGAPKDPNGK